MCLLALPVSHSERGSETAEGFLSRAKEECMVAKAGAQGRTLRAQLRAIPSSLSSDLGAHSQAREIMETMSELLGGSF